MSDKSNDQLISEYREAGKEYEDAEKAVIDADQFHFTFSTMTRLDGNPECPAITRYMKAMRVNESLYREICSRGLA